MDEFTPLDDFLRLFRRWWLIILCMLVGSLAAWVFHRATPPLYEASATIMATIDLDKFPFQDVRLDLIQYNEDLSLGAVEGALRSSLVQQALFSSAEAQAISLEAVSFSQAITIERKHSVWEARYRNTDPYIAQTVTNLWMQLGYDLMQSMQASGNMADFVILDPPNYAPLPSEPVAYHLNTLLLAGSMAGLILGVLLAIPLSHKKPQPLGSQHG